MKKAIKTVFWFVLIAGIVILGYIFFIQPEAEYEFAGSAGIGATGG